MDIARRLRPYALLLAMLLLFTGTAGLAALPGPDDLPERPKGTVQQAQRAAQQDLPQDTRRSAKKAAARQPRGGEPEGRKTASTADESTLVLPLENVAADRVADHVKRLFRGSSPVHVSADEPTNILLVRGEAATLQQVRQMISQLEEAAAAVTVGTKRELRVIPVQYADAQRVATMIRELAPFSSQGPPPSVEYDPRTNALLLNAAPADWDAILTIIKAVDVQD